MTQAILDRYQALKEYQRAGLSNQSFRALAEEAVIDSRLGSPSFWMIWPIEKGENNQSITDIFT